MSEDTNIKIKRKTKGRLDNFGKHGETYDKIINGMMAELEGFRKEILKKILTRKSEEK